MPTLSLVKKKIVVNAGHFDKDPGAVSAVERDEVKQIRDEAVSILKGLGFEVVPVPDNLDLPQSIAFANQTAPGLNEGLCIDIHLNSSSDKNARGAEAYHLSSDTSKQIAEKMAFYVSDRLRVPNRGPKPDTATHVGSLGWLRKTKAHATLIEVCFISNAEDMAQLNAIGGYKKAAQGIADAVLDLYGVVPKPTLADARKLIEEGTILINRGLDILKKI